MNNTNNEILVAPSWNKNRLNFINEDFEEIIDNLLNSGYKVRFRPHPETIKRSTKFNGILIKKNLRSKTFYLMIILKI